MPTDPTDVLIDAHSNVAIAVRENVGRHLRRLKRYPHFYRRLRTRHRIGTLLHRILIVGLVDGGFLLAGAVSAWSAIERRVRRRKDA